MAQPRRWQVRRAVWGLLLIAWAAMPVRGQEAPASPAGSELALDLKAITVTADLAHGWTEGNFHVLVARGNVYLEQGLTRVRMRDAVLWAGVATGDAQSPQPVLIYGEGNVVVEENTGGKRHLDRVFLFWRTQGELSLKAALQYGRPTDEDLLRRAELERQRAEAERKPMDTPPDLPAPPPPPAAGTPARTAKTSDAPTGGLWGGGMRADGVRIAPRGAAPFQTQTLPTGPDEQAVVITGGVVVAVGDPRNLADISADRVVVWVKGMPTGRGPSGLAGPSLGQLRKEQVELYLEGNVEIRQQALTGPAAGVTRLLRAERAYYDLGRNVALLTQSELIYRDSGIPQPVHLQAAELRQVNLNRFEATDATIFASRLPAGPDLKLFADEISVEQRMGQAASLLGADLGLPSSTGGRPVNQLWAEARGVRSELFGVPFFYVPHAEGDLREPFGPIVDLRFRSDRIMGTGLLLGLDAFQLLGLERPVDTRCRLDPDFHSRRGPGLATEFTTRGVGLFGIGGPYETLLRGEARYDYASSDILGLERELAVPNDFRGRFTLRHRHELSDTWTFQAGVGYQSDRNFLEQFRRLEFAEDVNQETFGYLKFQRDQYGLTLLAQPNIRNWVNETQSLPRLDGYLIGQDLLQGWFTYFGHASAGYYRLATTSDLWPAYLATPYPNQFLRDRPLPPSSDLPHQTGIHLGRFDFRNELDLPLHLGPLHFTPYGLAEGTYYTDTLTGEGGGRFFGGGGTRATLPFSRVYGDAVNDLFYLRGLAHKLNLEAEYRYVASSTDFRRLPLIDRLDDDATDQARRDLRVFRLARATRLDLATNPLYDPQLYHLRRGYLSSRESIDDLQFLRFGIRQRLQTKRGAFGQERIVDWMTLNTFATYFPDAGRDNFGNSFGFLEYDYTWAVGERTTILSHGWMDPFPGGAKVLNIGATVERPERLRFYAGYRQIEPLNVRALIFSTNYVLSPKYQFAWTSSYDFGQQQNLGQSLTLTRVGTDLTLNLGIGWDPLRNNLNFTLEIFPSLLGTNHLRHGILPTAAHTTLTPF